MNKNTLRVVIAAVGIVGSILILSCAEKLAGGGSRCTTTGNEDKVVFDETSVLIPGTAITEADQQAMNDVLAQHRTSLYKIDTYKDGELSRTRGKLPDERIGQAVVLSARENAKLRHLNGSAIQVGFAVGTQHKGTPAPGNTVGVQHTAAAMRGNTIGTQHHVTPTPGTEINSPTAKDYEDAAALVERLKPILKKYSQE